ncbi:aldo/keto reductase [Microbispora rosea]|uniref:aldo/keto reductase n=1 Tax=Microbispora rosea TaxID=58117 RepID=UPI003D91663F
MRTRELGRTGIEVSAYCLGTMMFGPLGNPDHDDCVRMTHRALDAGINFVDTADVYGYSETEVIVGKALKGRRDDVVLATKVNGRMGEGPNRHGSSRRWIIAEVEHSLRRLQTDYIDLYQIHHPDSRTDIEETLSALTDLVRSGKVQAIGSSNLPPSGIVEAQWVSERRALHRLRTEQPTYSILNRGAIIGPRTMEQLEDLLAGAAITLGDDILDKIDEIVPPGTDVGPLDISYDPPAVAHPALRRRPADDRAVA